MTAIGIDLGTSNTVVAHVKNGEPHTLCDAAGRRTIPSIISFHPSGTVLVGDPAKMRRYNDGPNTVTGAKRLMGRTWGSPEIAELQKRLSFPLREGKNKTIRALLRGELYSIPELSAFVIRKAKAWAEEALGEAVTEAVITVPANFNELQRQATKLAGELAGLEVMRVLNEPTAAALAFGHVAPAVKDEQVAVYDFGGGTFDLTMLRMSERELRVRATAGDMFLGGDDIDLAISMKIAEAYLAQHFYDPRTDPDVFARVRVGAERLKVALSKDLEATVPLNELMYGQGGKPIQWSYTMTRRELDAILDPFINQSLKVCEDALELLKASPRDFDRVVLVGGTTLSPRIHQRVAEFFGREPVSGVDPEEAVALGAAISGTMPVARKVKGALAQAQQAAHNKAMAEHRGLGGDEPLFQSRVTGEVERGSFLDGDLDYPVSQRFHEEEAGPVDPHGLFSPSAPPAGVLVPEGAPSPGGARRAVLFGVAAAVVVVGALASALWVRRGHTAPPAPPAAEPAATPPAPGQ